MRVTGASATGADTDDNIVSLVISAAGVRDGEDEVLAIGGVSLVPLTASGNDART